MPWAKGQLTGNSQVMGVGGRGSMREQRSRPEIGLHLPGTGVRKDSGGSGKALQGTSLSPSCKTLPCLNHRHPEKLPAEPDSRLPYFLAGGHPHTAVTAQA